MNILNKLNNTRGLTLVELMVSMVISAILMLGISEIFKQNSRSFKVQGEHARMQESGRYAFNTLMTDIRRAGYFGGNANKNEITGSLGISTPTTSCVDTDTTWARMLERPHYGLNDSNNDTSSDYTACISNDDYLQGDILVTRYSKGANIPISTVNLSANNDRLYARNSLFNGRLFKGSQVATGSESLGTGNYISETPNVINELAASAYYVGPSGRNCRFTAANNVVIPIPALFREILNESGIPIKQEVVNGVEHLQFQYGMDNNADLSVNQYYNADQISNNTAITPNWTQVVAVKLWILVRADCPTQGYTNTKTYAMGDIPGGYEPNDGFKRQLYRTIVSVRN